MVHKIIFFVLLFLEVIGLITLAQDFPLNFADTVGTILELITVFALYSFIYHKKHFSKQSWKALFYFLAFFWVIDLVDLMFLDGAIWGSLPSFFQSNFDYSKPMLMFGLILQVYFLYIIYQLSLGKKLQKSK